MLGSFLLRINRLETPFSFRLLTSTGTETLGG
jgi:hypothetical protein